jgi:hypothetical protein
VKEIEDDRKKARAYLEKRCEETWGKALPVGCIDLLRWAQDIEEGKHADEKPEL